MAALREWIDRLRGTLRPRRADRDLEEELRLHVAFAADDARRGGAAREDAARAAAIRSGGVAQAMEALRDQRSLPWVDDFIRDVRHAARLLRRNPVFTGVAVVSLALGIGANSAMFSLADALILRPLPVRDRASVVTVGADTVNEDTGGRMSYPNYRDLRDRSQSFDGLIAYQISRLSFGRSSESTREMRLSMLVSENYFDVLGVRPVIGRSFAADEGQAPGRDAVVVLSYGFWKNTLGGDASILHSVVWINGIAFQVVGVAPEDFTSTEAVVRPAFYVPLMMAPRLRVAPQNPLEDREARILYLKGRLKPGVAKRSAEAELVTLWTALERQYPEANRNRAIAVRTELEDRIRADPWDAVTIAIVMALSGIVLMIACANVANLMLGRVRARSREIAIRLAMGVSRARLVRQLLTESLLLASVGCACGLAVAYGAIRFLRTIPTADQIEIIPRLDERVLIVGLLTAVASAVLFGLAPARQSVKTDLVPALKTSELAEATRQRIIGRSVLVVAQVALSMVLLIATGVLLDAFRKAMVLDPGFRPDRLIMMSLDTSLVRYTPAHTRAFYRALVDRARGLTGVTAVTLAGAVPFLNGSQGTETVVPEGFEFPRGQSDVTTFASTVDEHYFETMQIAVVRGRGFTSADKDDARGVAIVNEEFAKRYWPNQDPIGKRLRLAERGSPWLEIVGVTKTGKYIWIGEPPTSFLYLPFAQRDKTRMSLLVQTNADPASLAAPLRDIVRTLDVNQPVFNLQTVSSLYEERTVAVPRMIMQVIGALGLLGLTLALVGLYGLVAYSVARRTREIGIRMAVGAGRSDVLRMVLRQGLMLATIGIAIGGVASVAVARLLAAALVGLGAPNPATYIVVPALLVCLTLAASYFPARRASLVDPLAALRYE